MYLNSFQILFGQNVIWTFFINGKNEHDLEYGTGFFEKKDYAHALVLSHHILVIFLYIFIYTYFWSIIFFRSNAAFFNELGENSP